MLRRPTAQAAVNTLACTLPKRWKVLTKREAVSTSRVTVGESRCMVAEISMFSPAEALLLAVYTATAALCADSKGHRAELDRAGGVPAKIFCTSTLSVVAGFCSCSS